MMPLRRGKLGAEEVTCCHVANRKREMYFGTNGKRERDK